MGTYIAALWIEGNCGYSTLAGNKIGINEDDCIVGKWYTLAPDPYGGPNQLLYKDYYSNGTGLLVIPDESKTIHFRWNLSGQADN